MRADFSAERHFPFRIALLLALLAMNAFVATKAVRVLIANDDWVEHTQHVLLQLETVESLLKDAETGQRGYLYTDQAQYLEPYNTSVKQLPGQIAELRRLIADNPGQVSRAADLQSLADRRMNILREAIDLHSFGHENRARQLVLSGEGKQTMDSIRSLVDEMQREESRLESLRVAASRQSTRFALLTFWLATAIAAVALVVVAWITRREMRQREHYLALVNKSEAELRTTLESIGDGVIATDVQGNITFVNRVAESLTGYRGAEVLGMPLVAVFRITNEVTGAAVDNPVNEVLKHGKSVGLANHTVLKRSDGSIVPISDSAAPICDTSGNLIGVVLVFRDASEERKTVEALRRADKLAASARMAATLSHEINNPLEAVTNAIYLLGSETSLSGAARMYVAIAERELARLALMARRTLSFQGAHGTKSCRVSEVMNEVLESTGPKIDSLGAKVERSYTQDDQIALSRAGLQQVLTNLIMNSLDAIGLGGSIRIWITRGDSAEQVRVVVEDNGSGIDQKHIDSIFDPFFTTKKEYGTGLGLWAVKNIVEEAGGRVEVESSTGGAARGTRVVLTLPRAVGEKSTIAA